MFRIFRTYFPNISWLKKRFKLARANNACSETHKGLKDEGEPCSGLRITPAVGGVK